MTPQLWKRARAEVDYDPCCATFDEVAAAPLSRIWGGGTASEYRELHLIEVLAAQAIALLLASIVTELRRKQMAARA